MDYIYDAWPELNYENFKATKHLLHMASQVMGKYKLHTPFEPHWSNVALWLTSKGWTTGIIPYRGGVFSIEMDLMNHKIICDTSWSGASSFELNSTSVADLTSKLFELLRKHQINLEINLMPQEIPNPISFEKDTEIRNYNAKLANTFWKILLSVQRVLQLYHSHFDGESPPIGFMWGTFDIRDARFNGLKVEVTGANKTSYIRRNAMDEAQIEVGFWPGTEIYPQPAFYAFTYPQPKNIENTKIQPSSAYWNKDMGEFILDYGNVRQAQNPDMEILNFFESAYRVGAKLSEGWTDRFVASGEPV